MDNEHLKKLDEKYSNINRIKYNQRASFNNRGSRSFNSNPNSKFRKRNFSGHINQYSNRKPVSTLRHNAHNKELHKTELKSPNTKHLSESSDSDLEDTTDIPKLKLGLETEEEIQTWREERKKNYPSKENIQLLSLYHRIYPEINELRKSSKINILKKNENKHPKYTKRGRHIGKTLNHKTNRTNTILESVLMDQIVEESVWLLQAIRYIVKNKFFDDD